jgi:hypothetical protein
LKQWSKQSVLRGPKVKYLIRSPLKVKSRTSKSIHGIKFLISKYMTQMCFDRPAPYLRVELNYKLIFFIETFTVIHSMLNQHENARKRHVCVWNLHAWAYIFKYLFLVRHAQFSEQTSKCDFNTHGCDWWTNSVTLTLSRVFSSRKIWFSHAECDFDTDECENDMLAYNLYTQSPIFTLKVWFIQTECDYHTQCVILKRTSMILYAWVMFRFEKVW